MSKVPFEKAVEDAVRADSRYAADAYIFLRDALDVTIKTMQQNRRDAVHHVSGAELCEGVRDYALQQYGPMVPTIFDAWGIAKTRDIGEMVFNLIRTGAFSRSDSDKIEDFDDIFTFQDAFEKPFLPSRGTAPVPAPAPSPRRKR
jgi:uncharacterized repeat protein (TIGR04138 family)